MSQLREANLRLRREAEEETRFAKMADERRLKMLEREMIAQTNSNPFLLGNDYLEDLSVQDQFLTPQNSNFDSDYKRK